MKIPFTQKTLDKQEIHFIWMEKIYALKTPVQSAVILGTIYMFGGFRDYSFWGLVGMYLVILAIVHLFRHRNDVDIISHTHEIYSGGGGDEDSFGIIDIIGSSEKYLYIVSPYIAIGKNLFRDIEVAVMSGVQVTILVNKNSLQRNFIETLKRFQGIGCKVYLHPNLHSKIFLNEKLGIITSLNLLNQSIENSLEIGVRITSDENIRALYELIGFYLEDSDTSEFEFKKILMGHCIRTGTEIVFDVNKPIEYNEYKSTPDKTGHYCHKCGEQAKTTVTSPFCNKCS